MKMKTGFSVLLGICIAAAVMADDKVQTTPTLTDGYTHMLKNDADGEAFLISEGTPADDTFTFRVMAHKKVEDQIPVLGMVMNYQSPDHYDAVLLSIGGAHPGLYYGSVRDGQYNTVEYTDIDTLKWNAWYSVRVNVDPGNITIRCEDRVVTVNTGEQKTDPGKTGFVVRTANQEGMFQWVTDSLSQL